MTERIMHSEMHTEDDKHGW